ncbi:hypothetical protein [Candidatus Williamhamiltonella defendens]|uniref:hypothetical protein n=1 Tax=Candidatus Williamhamiltonella defendens TaxID=138072 RepID=UPI00387E63DF
MNALNTFVIETLGPQTGCFYQIMISHEQEVGQQTKNDEKLKKIVATQKMPVVSTG